MIPTLTPQTFAATPIGTWTTMLALFRTSTTAMLTRPFCWPCWAVAGPAMMPIETAAVANTALMRVLRLRMRLLMHSSLFEFGGRHRPRRLTHRSWAQTLIEADDLPIATHSNAWRLERLEATARVTLKGVASTCAGRARPPSGSPPAGSFDPRLASRTAPGASSATREARSSASRVGAAARAGERPEDGRPLPCGHGEPR